MNPLLSEIFSTGQVKDKEGNLLPLHSHTVKEQCDFLQEIIHSVKPFCSLEIGLAYGISTLAILEALKNSVSSFKHIIIDPFQENWKNIGLLNIERAGFTANTQFHAKFSDQVLPELYFQNQRIQLAYIDSTKVFDVLLTDVYFINKILDVNGVLILDDCGYPGIRLLVRFLSQHPSFEIYKVLGEEGHSGKRRFVKAIDYFILKSLPFGSKVLPGYNFKSDAELGVNYHCIAFRKIKEDNRHWDWHKAF